MSIRLVESVQRVGRRSHVQHRQVFVDVFGNKELDRMSEEEVDVLDKAEEVVPRAVLFGGSLVCKITLDCNVSRKPGL